MLIISPVADVASFYMLPEEVKGLSSELCDGVQGMLLVDP